MLFSHYPQRTIGQHAARDRAVSDRDDRFPTRANRVAVRGVERRELQPLDRFDHKARQVPRPGMGPNFF